MRTSIKALAAASVLAGTLLAATPAFADETAPPSPVTITGSAALVSQYRFRGISQSDNKPAVQGSITISTEPGFYIATWGSSATAGNSTVNIGGTEIDVYGGYTHALGKSGVTVDVGVYGYLYPGATGLNYYEIYGNLSGSLGPLNAKAGIYVAPDQKNVVKANTYVYGELSAGIPNTPITIHTHLGHTGGGFDYTRQYLDYSVGASVAYKNLTLDFSLVGTNVSHANAAANPFNDGTGTPSPFETYRAAKAVGVVSLTASF
ncbi:MAG: TorF family putative porin [Sphingomonadales bacterium]|nr:TorF family putative porin [Sphingomonadales bacterium]MDE2568225.1 TorF family putative porin [Sphingomonadales bacterium]